MPKYSLTECRAMSKKEEREWQAQMDLDTMIQAKMIEKDPERVRNMKRVAKKVAGSQLERAQATIAVSKMKATAKAKARKRS